MGEKVHQQIMGGGADNVGSEDHYEQWKRDGGEVRAAENEMMAKTESMRGDIKEKMVLSMAQQLEGAVDAQLAQMEEEMGDLASLRKKRIQQMQKDAQLKKELAKIGHGKYEEIADEKEFFATAKKSEGMVCHFYRDATWRCEIVDKHLKLLATKCFKTRFVKINAEKSPFLVERLKVFMLPTLACVSKGQVVDYVVGFDDLGGTDDFPTEALAARLATAGVCEYEGGDIAGPKGPPQKNKKGYVGHRKERGDSSDDYDSDDYN